MNLLRAKLEAILFYRAEPVKISELAKALKISPEDVRSALGELKESLQGRGIALVLTDDEAALATAPEVSPFIEGVAKEELARDLGRAGLETLSIILYEGPVSRSRIDYIRGVNSAFIVRHLLMRGLIERIPNPTDSRGFLYKSSVALLSFLGVSAREELPDFAGMHERLTAIDHEPTNDAS